MGVNPALLPISWLEDPSLLGPCLLLRPAWAWGNDRLTATQAWKGMIFVILKESK